MSTTGQTAFRYLPVSAAGQTLGIPLESIRQILMSSELPVSQPAAADQDGSQPGEEVVTINLGRLLTNREQARERSQIIVIDAAPQRIALVVDSIAPLKIVEPGSYFVMPAIFGARQALFGGVIRSQDGLTLLLDPDLISLISTAAEDR